VEAEKAAVQSELSDVRGSLRDVESARAETHGRWQQTRRDLTAAETECNSLNDKLNDLCTSLTHADDTLETLRKENFDLKQKVELFTSFSSLKCFIADSPVNSQSGSYLLTIFSY